MEISKLIIQSTSQVWFVSGIQGACYEKHCIQRKLTSAGGGGGASTGMVPDAPPCLGSVRPTLEPAATGGATQKTIIESRELASWAGLDQGPKIGQGLWPFTHLPFVHTEQCPIYLHSSCVEHSHVQI